jgi:glycosyltransferase involved in cell wall biosynthesis
MTEPRISVVIPMYDCVLYLADAVESVLGQTLPPFEVILVDDGSTDGSLALARSFEPRVKVVSQANRGIGGARNTGIRLATGDYLAFQDADDLWALDKLALQWQVLGKRPDLDSVYGSVRQFYSPEMDVSEAERKQMSQKTVSTPVAAASLFRRSSFDRVGLFREDVRIGEFVDWLARADDLGLRYFGIDSIVIERRIHNTNTGVRERQSRFQYARVLKDVLDRRRASSGCANSGNQGPAT